MAHPEELGLEGKDINLLIIDLQWFYIVSEFFVELRHWTRPHWIVVPEDHELFP